MHRRFQLSIRRLCWATLLTCVSLGALSLTEFYCDYLDVELTRISRRAHVTGMFLCPFGPRELRYWFRLKGPTECLIYSTGFRTCRSWLCAYHIDHQVEIPSRLPPGTYRLDMLPEDVWRTPTTSCDVELGPATDDGSQTRR